MELSEQVLNSIVEETGKLKGWLKFVGIMTIIAGALQALSIIGIIIAWIPIWMGVLLLQAGKAAEQIAASADASKLVEFIAKLRTYFLLQGILIILGIVGVFLLILFYIVMGISIFGGMMSNQL